MNAGGRRSWGLENRRESSWSEMRTDSRFGSNCSLRTWPMKAQISLACPGARSRHDPIATAYRHFASVDDRIRVFVLQLPVRAAELFARSGGQSADPLDSFTRWNESWVAACLQHGELAHHLECHERSTRGARFSAPRMVDDKNCQLRHPGSARHAVCRLSAEPTRPRAR